MRLKQPSFEEAHSAGMDAFYEGRSNMPPANYDKKHAETWKWGHSHAKSSPPRSVAEPAPESKSAPRQEDVREMGAKTKKQRGNRSA